MTGAPDDLVVFRTNPTAGTAPSASRLSNVRTDRRAVMRWVVATWAIASCAALVVGQFLPHTHGLKEWNVAFFGITDDVYGDETGWENGDGWVVVPLAAVAVLAILRYAFGGWRRHADVLLLGALAAAVLATLFELLGLAFLSEECGSGNFLKPSCPPGLNALREAAWGLYVTLGAAVSLAVACVTLSLLGWYEPERQLAQSSNR